MQAVFKKEDITKALGVTLGVVEKKQTCFSESVGRHPKSPDASECIRTDPNASEHVRKLQKTCKSDELLATFREILRKFVENCAKSTPRCR